MVKDDAQKILFEEWKKNKTTKETIYFGNSSTKNERKIMRQMLLFIPLLL
jgi:hypothetical protein